MANVENFVNQVIQKMEQGLYNEALFILEEVLFVSENEQALWFKVQCYSFLNETQQVLKFADEYLKKYGEDSFVLFWKASAHYDLGEYYEAIRGCKKSLELNSEYTNGYLLLGRSLYELNFFEQAVLNFDKVIELKNDHFDAYVHRAKTKMFLDVTLEESLKDIDVAMRYSRDVSSFVKKSYIEFCILDEQYEKALSIIELLSEEYSFDSSSIFKSIALYCVGRKDESLNSFQKYYEFCSELIDEYKKKIDILNLRILAAPQNLYLKEKVEKIINVLDIVSKLKLELTHSAKDFCSFCGKGLLLGSEYAKVDGVCICESCLDLCDCILEEKNNDYFYSTLHPSNEKTEEEICSFCGRAASEVQLIVASDSAYICNGCVGVCKNMIKNRTDYKSEYLESVKNWCPIVEQVLNTNEKNAEYWWQKLLVWVFVVCMVLSLFFYKIKYDYHHSDKVLRVQEQSFLKK